MEGRKEERKKGRKSEEIDKSGETKTQEGRQAIMREKHIKPDSEPASQPASERQKGRMTQSTKEVTNKHASKQANKQTHATRHMRTEGEADRKKKHKHTNNV